MKKAIFILLILITSGASAQMVEIQKKVTRITGVGDELIKARDDFNFGTAFLLFGSTIALSPAVLPVRSDGTEAAALRIGGGCMMATGIVFQILSMQHVGKAGELMNKPSFGLLLNDTGAGVCYKF